MSECKFKFDKGESVEVVFRGKIHQRRDNTDEPKSYVVEMPTKGGRSHYRTFYEHEIVALPKPGGVNDNVVALREVAA